MHATGILTVPIILLYDKATASLVLGLILLTAFTLSVYRSERKRFRQKLIVLEQLFWLEERLEHFIDRHSREGEFPVKGALMFFLGAFIALQLFGPLPAAAGIAVLALGDSASTIVGKIYGTHKLPWSSRKTWEGSTAFFLFAFFPLYFMLPQQALIIAFLATLTEMIPNTHVDDNITIPNIVAALVHYL